MRSHLVDLMGVITYFFCYWLVSAAPVFSSSPDGTTGMFANLRFHLHDLESKLLKDLKAELKEKGIHLQGFYHTARVMQHWKEVYSEQLRLLDGYHRDVQYPLWYPKPLGVMDLAEKLHIVEATFKDNTAGSRNSASLEDVMREDVRPSYAEKIQFSRSPSITRDTYW